MPGGRRPQIKPQTPAQQPQRPAPIQPTPATAAPQPSRPRVPLSPTPASPAAPLASAEIEAAALINPLVSAAAPTLSLLVNLRNTPSMDDPLGLRTKVEGELSRFMSQAQAGGIAPETVNSASYCLCTAVDEVVLSTPWGARSPWREQSLLKLRHGDAWGGEKFFAVLERALAAPASNRDLLELLYLCLVLGFEGKYAVLNGGRRKLEDITENLYQTLRGLRGEPERDLSPHWQGEPEARVVLTHALPPWVLAALAGVLLLAIYLLLRFLLASASEPVLGRLAQLGREEPPVREILVPKVENPVVADDVSEDEEIVPLTQPEVDLAASLSQFLAPEIEQELVEVLDGKTRVTVRILGSGLFAPAREKLSGDFVPRIRRISEGLGRDNDNIRGGITVVGHSDNVPLRRGLRFQDNWDLSAARAKTVADLLRSNPAITQPITQEGVADTQPIATNKTREGRARNRRVEILVGK